MSTHPANWYPDPMGRNEHRYYDGNEWTEHVSNQGVTSVDPLQGTRFDRFDSALTVGNEADPTKIDRQIHDTGSRGAGISAAPFGGGGSIFTEPILVVNQKAKLIELNNQYSVFDGQGRQLASVNQVGQSAAKKALRLVASVDQFMTHKLLISDANGNPLMHLTRPAKIIKSTVIVSDGFQNEIGRIVQQNVFGKISFGLEAGGQNVGWIRAENWRAWNFRLEDANGNEVGRITKTFEGVMKTMFTTADNYVVQFHAPVAQPLLSLLVASALSVDTALKQDSRGFG